MCGFCKNFGLIQTKNYFNVDCMFFSLYLNFVAYYILCQVHWKYRDTAIIFGLPIFHVLENHNKNIIWFSVEETTVCDA